MHHSPAVALHGTRPARRGAVSPPRVLRCDAEGVRRKETIAGGKGGLVWETFARESPLHSVATDAVQSLAAAKGIEDEGQRRSDGYG
jgi:hypothetical protein